jgi:hypothetical protein
MELLAVGMVDLGLTAAQFGELTPRQFHALCQRKVYNDAVARFWIFKAQGAKHLDGRELALADFLPDDTTRIVYESRSTGNDTPYMSDVQKNIDFLKTTFSDRGFGRWSEEPWPTT